MGLSLLNTPINLLNNNNNLITMQKFNIKAHTVIVLIIFIINLVLGIYYFFQNDYFKSFVMLTFAVSLFSIISLIKIIIDKQDDH